MNIETPFACIPRDADSKIENPELSNLTDFPKAQEKQTTLKRIFDATGFCLELVLRCHHRASSGKLLNY
jgi:hypothetical protein